MPDDLSGVTNDDLAALQEQAATEFDTLYEGGATAEKLTRATELADAIETLTAEKTRREQAAAETAQQFDAIRARIDGLRTPTDVEAEPTPEPVQDPEPEPTPEVVASAPEPALVADARPKTDVRDVIKTRKTLNPSLANAARHAPNPNVPDRVADELVITAATATAGMPIGSRFETMDRLVQSINSYAKGTPVTHGNPSYVPLASIKNRFDVVLSDRSGAADVEAALKQLTNPETLVAAGGWCAPSEIRYDFFNIVCDDGRVDLPTFGVERGGIRYPTSPSMADVFTGTFTNATNPWLWTEADDILAATGSPTKPCVRVPCPSFNERRLEAYGICLTAGNLTDAAYPEATRNYLKLLMSAQYRAISTRYINTMVALSTLSTPSTGIGAAGAGMTAPLLGSVEMAAIDYRTRYGMCDTAILEVVLPSWAKGAIRSDLAKRNGLALFEVTDQMIADWFDVRNVRVQFITDWQVRASGSFGFSTVMSAWPTTIEFLIYAAGTFVRGNGMSLDLGVVRDSTLNAVNDHTAAWMEETHLIAMFGHESRRYVINICTDGTTGAADLTACGL